MGCADRYKSVEDSIHYAVKAAVKLKSHHGGGRSGGGGGLGIVVGSWRMRFFLRIRLKPKNFEGYYTTYTHLLLGWILTPVKSSTAEIAQQVSFHLNAP